MVTDGKPSRALVVPAESRHRLNVAWKYRVKRIRLYIVDDHVDIVTEDGDHVGEIVLNPEKNYQPLLRRTSR